MGKKISVSPAGAAKILDLSSRPAAERLIRNTAIRDLLSGLQCIYTVLCRNAVIDEIVQQENTEPLQLALQQQVFSIDTTIPSLEDTVIHYITKTGSLQCVRCMLESVGTNFPFELRDDKGNNILHSAVQGGKKEHVQLILDLAVMKETGSNKLDDFLNAKTSIGICVVWLLCFRIISGRLLGN